MVKKRIGLFLFFIFIAIIISSYFIFFSNLPGTLSIIKDNESILKLSYPFHLYIKAQEDSNLQINGKTVGNKYLRVNTGSPLVFEGKEIGQSVLNFKLFGLIPIKSVRVNVLPEIRVFPGGQAIGVLLRSKGVMVVGNSFVEDINGKRFYPAKEAGLEIGDIIYEINNQEINDKSELSSIIQKIGSQNQNISLKIRKRNGQMKNTVISPVKNKDGIYMIGLYVKDGVAGVGTLTFYEPDSGEYGALGHVITETNGNIEIEVRKGQIVEAQISGINYGQQGIPGEKQGTFFQTNDILGQIEKNTKFGIYGKLKNIPDNPYFKKPIPVAAISQVKRGPAKIYTVVKGGNIEEFSIHIDRVYHQSMPDSKGMIINITDPNLKRMTGGIIQGMSGSPIVQNGKLVGAVTHVFVNNPSRGYGVFAEWMLKQTNIMEKNDRRAVNY